MRHDCISINTGSGRRIFLTCSLLIPCLFTLTPKSYSQGITANPNSAFQTESLTVTFTGTGATFSQITETCVSDQFYVSTGTVFFETFSPTYQKINATLINTFTQGDNLFTAEFDIPFFAPAGTYKCDGG